MVYEDSFSSGDTSREAGHLSQYHFCSGSYFKHFHGAYLLHGILFLDSMGSGLRRLLRDTLDGMLARSSGKETSFGAFFDSVLDRYGDTFILMGLAWVFSGGPLLLRTQSAGMSSIQSPVTVFFISMAIIGSFTVSYTRARANGLGITYKIGLMQRSGRIVLLTIGSLLGSVPHIGLLLMKATLFILALSTNITAIQRMKYVRHQLL